MASEVRWVAVCLALLPLVEVELVYVVGRLSCEMTSLLWLPALAENSKTHSIRDINPTDCGPKTDGQRFFHRSTRRRPLQRARVGAVHDIRSHEHPWQLQDDHRKARGMLVGAGP